ncbi:MAG TPA: hypothetical protein VGU72_04380 [Beijerinckiaceae bacterium]|jgi:hypothetical protein|nr:hypothetical protein [Beijerinckiaceae bacterium]
MALTVKITKGGVISIRLNKADLKYAAQHLPALERFDEKMGCVLLPKIVDAGAFAEAIYRQLRAEEEDGTTVVHRMLDDAIEEAVEYGAEGIRLPGDDDYGRPKRL